MFKKTQKIGNSRGIVLDSTILKLLGIDKDDFVDLEISKDKLILRKPS
jgi:antitoxin component of MazEF toxin-antitoxin module